MAKIIEIKQTKNAFAKSLNQDVDFTVNPNSVRVYFPRKDRVSGDWITGLNEEQSLEYGKKIKQDLSSSSDFWESLEIRLVNRTASVVFNLDSPMDFIRYKCAIANKFLAENKEQLKEPGYHINDCFLYVYDPVGDLKRENSLQELKDECTALIFEMRTQKEKMFYIFAKTGNIVNETWTAGILYKNLRLYLDSLKKEELLENFRDLLTSDNELLQTEYAINKAFGKQIKNVNKQWVFGGNNLGSTKESVIKAFKENDDMLILLLEEVGTI